MQRSSAFVLSSLWEEVGFVIVEAALCNSLVISSNCPNGPREFLNNGERGILFDSNKKNALFKSFKAFSKMDKNQLFKNKVSLKISLKYYEGDPVIKEIKRISKPGRRVYSRATSIPKVMNGLGLAILSTPKGVMSDTEARKNNVGGEIICRVF